MKSSRMFFMLSAIVALCVGGGADASVPVSGEPRTFSHQGNGEGAALKRERLKRVDKHASLGAVNKPSIGLIASKRLQKKDKKRSEGWGDQKLARKNLEAEAVQVIPRVAKGYSAKPVQLSAVPSVPVKKPLKRRTRIVISCDGGGVRGLIPAEVLKYLEDQLGFHLTEVVDVFAGSSTGGLIALGLTMPDKNGKPLYDMGDLVNLYETKGGIIFNENDKKYSLKGYWRALYPLKGIRSVLEGYFGDAQLSNTVKEVFITSYDLDHAQPYFFTTTAAKKSKSHEFKVKDLAESTARAQGFLEFESIKNAKGQTFNLIDGGNVENNPAELAYYHARSLYPHDNIIVISISTGDLRSSIDAKNMYGGGLAEWVAPTIALQMGVHSLLVDWRMSQLLSDDLKADQFYVRIDKHLTDADADLDFTNVSQENIQKLKRIGREVVAGYKDVLDELVVRLKQVKAERGAASHNWKKTKRVGVVKQSSERFAEEGQKHRNKNLEAHKKNQELYHSTRKTMNPLWFHSLQHAPKSKAQPEAPQVKKSSDEID